MAVRIAAGGFFHECRNGFTIGIDRRLSREKADLLAELIERAGHKPSDVIAVTLEENEAMAVLFELVQS